MHSDSNERWQSIFVGSLPPEIIFQPPSIEKKPKAPWHLWSSHCQLVKYTVNGNSLNFATYTVYV